jgi:4-amino-4-deoxychorismate lyase
MNTPTWINGCATDQLTSADRGLQYGDGLFETITCIDGRPRWLALHLQRLRRGCERLQLPFADFEALGAEIAAMAIDAGRCIVKLILTRGPARRRGYRPDGSESPTRILTRHEWPVEAASVTDFRVGISSVRLGMNPLLAGLKHLNRLEQVMAQSAMRDAPLEEVLMLSSAGQVIGGSMSNVFFADDSGLFTPALEDCGVAGIMRQLVCQAAMAAGTAVQVRAVDPRELPRVREAFVTNVRWGVQSITALDGRALTRQSHARALWRLIDAADP